MTQFDQQSAGQELHALVARLYPLCRSITGAGVRATLDILHEHIPLQTHEIPTGTKVFDWTVPREWVIRDAYIKAPSGQRVVDFQKCNLHVLNYSTPIHARMRLAELRPHLFSLPEYPRWIPYRTSYYSDNWGFCLAHEQLTSLKDVEYEVCIDAEHCDGSLTYGDLLIPGELPDEVLFSAHICHPSLCNDNLSGIAVATLLARHLLNARRRFSYRFVFAPVTIGALAWLSQNQTHLSRIRHGLVLTLLGDSGKLNYKRSRQGNAHIDQVVEHVLQHSGDEFGLFDFEPTGYDERQYCSPGFNLPVGRLLRTPHATFPEYHTSADNLDFVRPEFLADSLDKLTQVIDVLEQDRCYVNLYPHGEPQLGRRGLYREIGGPAQSSKLEQAILWVLNQSDGNHSLLEIARRANLPFPLVATAANRLEQHGLLRAATSPEAAPPSTRPLPVRNGRSAHEKISNEVGTK